ncbi:MAG: aminomethyl transferase family protein [Armatimonadota bacterium]|nr:aminomethyl transferase family protein [Armatimonadota bacterium]MDR7439931.1 aminomethyl transferase family protein [Armatimonadota bacterium]MDR7562711.1 aminomethyl transferase family protein [Armatimonadota bacterium]MDR7567860.1 aminomethyl transferase family protein [Armatimonadota bacterium]MDR7601010.1 aminomethyl transferase family protein [Armatimonadota bacterium]
MPAGTCRTLEDIVQSAGNIVDFLRNNPTGAYVFVNVPREFTNWIEEQESWRQTVAFFDQTHHMEDLYIRGPDAVKLLSRLGVNSFRNFEPGMAKHLYVCNERGYVIGDAVLFYLETELLQLVGRPMAHNWVQFHGEKDGYRVEFERDERSAVNPRGRRKMYRFQLQGPNATPLLEKLNGGPLPEIKFFHMGWISIAGRRVRALHHGMAGVAGLEIFGPWEEREEVRGAILEAGKEFGLRQVGTRAYPTNTLESAWISTALPAIYTREDLRAYREWLPATSFEATGSLGGSFYSKNVEDYYLTPFDLGAGRIVRFDHEFVGRQALEEMAREPRRTKVTLVWNPEDVLRAIGTLFQKGPRAKYMEFPLSNYAVWPYDKVLSENGDVIGFSKYTGYSANERAVLSLGVVDVRYSQPGTQVVVVWGEEGGGTRKPAVERHTQVEIRATVGPAPYSEPARQYRAMVRTR